MAITLWNHKNYLLDIPYLIATNIYEYDIRKANINVLYSLGYIDKKYYDMLNNMSRMHRQVEIGYAQIRDPSLVDKLKDGIILYKKKFLESNNIDDSEILSIKNDAIFTINKIASNTKFDNIDFVLKNNYSSYMRFGSIEVYFKSNMVNNQFDLDVKGINDITLKLHEKYMCTWLANTLYDIEVGDLDIVIQDLQKFYNDYINRRLPLGFYRSFDSSSCYYISYGDVNYMIRDIDVSEIQSININVNLEIIRTMYRYASELYFCRKNKVSRR